ncbi:MAG: CDP-diacylglycerol--glycerol-3-phosphate 3-phosphatidyltransferase [FCB group bacterium]|nr:CDP-diacylglycerol--glycerol-3-phosphate 3-phosphatidyltransferase [FCB group bacterium]
MAEHARDALLQMNLPNRLTLARVVMAPIFVGLMSVDHAASFALAYVTFTAAAITDYYDGKIARERNLVSNFGKLWDPVADKVIMSAAFVMMMTMPELCIPGWTVVAILTREFVITGARSFAASDGLVIGANRWGKTKTVVQIVYVQVFLFFAVAGRVLAYWQPAFVRDHYSVWLGYASLLSIIMVALYTLYSGLQFARMNLHSFGIGKAQ